MTMKWSVEEFDASAWDALNDAAGGPALNSGHPALHSINVQLLLKHFGTGEESVWVCRRGRSPVAMVVLTGRLVANAWHPDNQTVALWVQRDDVDFADLARLLARRGLMLSVTHIDPDMLKRPDGHEPVECIETVNYIETARTVVSGSFEDYWQSRRDSVKANDRKFRNRIKTIAVRMEAVTDPAAIGAAVDAFGILESAGWKGKNGSALHPDNPQGAYYRELFTAYAANGWASVWECRYEDKLVASNLLIHRDGTVLSLKITYDESQKKSSPSLLLRHETFKQIWPHTDVIEYYGEEKGWHGWADDQRRMYHLNAFRAPWVQALRACVRRRKQQAALSTPVEQLMLAAALFPDVVTSLF